MTAPGADLWINTVRYSTPGLVAFGLGCVFWLIAYAGILLQVRRRQFVEIPAAAVVANVSWEFLWSFAFTQDTGRLFVWGYRGWVFLDIFIVYCLFAYGANQVVNPAIRRYFAASVVFGIMSWTAALYCFGAGGYDMSMGATSAYIINVMMSATYLVLLYTHPPDLFSQVVGWSKGLGTAFFTVFMFLEPLHRYQEDAVTDKRFLLVLCLVTLALDTAYIAGLHARTRDAHQAAAAAA